VWASSRPYQSPEAPRPELFVTVFVSAALVELARYWIGVHKYSANQIVFSFLANAGIQLWQRPDSVPKAAVASVLGEASTPGLISLCGIFFWKVVSVVHSAGRDALLQWLSA